MELATLTLKLSGQTANTVVKRDVTPAQLAMYAYMHGEDCALALTLTGVDTARNNHNELNRLHNEFTSEHAKKCMATLFPGAHPHLPTTFRAIGYDPEILVENVQAARVTPQAKNDAEGAIMNKIKQASTARQAELTGNGVAKLPPVDPIQQADMLDDTGGDEDDDGGDNSLQLDDDPIDAEINHLNNLPPAPQG